MNSNIRVLIKIYYVCLILYFSGTVFGQIIAPAVDAAAFNPKVIKTLLANELIKFFNSGNPAFSNGPKSLPKNHPDCFILDK